jgi:hypothetical protein
MTMGKPMRGRRPFGAIDPPREPNPDDMRPEYDFSGGVRGKHHVDAAIAAIEEAIEIIDHLLQRLRLLVFTIPSGK